MVLDSHYLSHHILHIWVKNKSRVFPRAPQYKNFFTRILFNIKKTLCITTYIRLNIAYTRLLKKLSQSIGWRYNTRICLSVSIIERHLYFIRVMWMVILVLTVGKIVLFTISGHIKWHDRLFVFIRRKRVKNEVLLYIQTKITYTWELVSQVLRSYYVQKNTRKRERQKRTHTHTQRHTWELIRDKYEVPITYTNQ